MFRPITINTSQFLPESCSQRTREHCRIGTGVGGKQQLDSLTAQYQQLLDQAKQAAAGVPANAGVSEIASAFLPLATSLQSLGTSTKNTLSAIQADSKALKQGFDDAKSCKEFRS